ncbi:RraA family protein [Patulibacter defluvii]|uniref:RraA family protein n=1 Tax=Patulibacter defluvii TaxID=3095358 RepID=UPI002A7495A6|nr:RraA family protein [Patulibacter sp. DM4]
MTQTAIAHTELVKRFEAVYTSTLSDVLDELGHTEQCLSPSIAPLRPGMRLAGPAFVAEGRPSTGLEYQSSMRRILECLQAVPARSVAVYKSHDGDSAQLGDLAATSLIARGCAGVITDGGCRDVAMVLESGLPVFCRFRTPRDCTPRWDLLRWGHSVEIGGVTVNTGDYLVADHDGTVVIPHQLRDEVLTRAEEIVRTERAIRVAIREGLPPLDALDRYGMF